MWSQMGPQNQWKLLLHVVNVSDVGLLYSMCVHHTALHCNTVDTLSIPVQIHKHTGSHVTEKVT